MKKYYKFCTSPPWNFVKMFYVFTGSIATENYKYASTQFPLDSDSGDENHVDLNLASAIVDLIEGPNCPVQKLKSKSKGKRKCDIDWPSLNSSKCSTKGKEVYTRITSDLNFIKDIVIRNMKITDNSPFVGDAKFAPRCSGLSSAKPLMTIVNALASEMSMPIAAYLDMCRALNDPHWASVVENMTSAGQRMWVASFMPSGDA